MKVTIPYFKESLKAKLWLDELGKMFHKVHFKAKVIAVSVFASLLISVQHVKAQSRDTEHAIVEYVEFARQYNQSKTSIQVTDSLKSKTSKLIYALRNDFDKTIEKGDLEASQHFLMMVGALAKAYKSPELERECHVLENTLRHMRNERSSKWTEHFRTMDIHRVKAELRVAHLFEHHTIDIEGSNWKYWAHKNSNIVQGSAKPSLEEIIHALREKYHFSESDIQDLARHIIKFF